MDLVTIDKPRLLTNRRRPNSAQLVDEANRVKIKEEKSKPDNEIKSSSRICSLL